MMQFKAKFFDRTQMIFYLDCVSHHTFIYAFFNAPSTFHNPHALWVHNNNSRRGYFMHFVRVFFPSQIVDRCMASFAAETNKYCIRLRFRLKGCICFCWCWNLWLCAVHFINFHSATHLIPCTPNVFPLYSILRFFSFVFWGERTTCYCEQWKC